MEAVKQIDGDSIAWSWLRGHPPSNVWAGTTVEDWKRADERIPLLLKIPAKVRFLSCEPLLEPVDLSFYFSNYKTHEREIQRGSNIRSGEAGPIEDRVGRDNLEDCRVTGQSMEQERIIAQCSKNAGGTRPRSILSSPKDVGGEKNTLPSPSIGLVALQWTPTGKRSDQSQECGQKGQSPRKSGSHDGESEHTSCIHGGHIGSARSKKPIGEADRLSGGSNSSDVSKWAQDSGPNCETVSCFPSKHLEDCKGRSQAETERADCGLHNQAKSRDKEEGPYRSISWVIVGGESGPYARPMHPDWARSLRDQCVAAHVPFFFKQWGHHNSFGEPVGKVIAGRELDGREWSQMPATW